MPANTIALSVGQTQDEPDSMSGLSSETSHVVHRSPPEAAVVVRPPEDLSPAPPPDQIERQILNHLPDGVAVIDDANQILWANPRFVEMARTGDVLQQEFFSVLENPQILGPDYCPFSTALATGQPSYTILSVGDSNYLHVHVSSTGMDGRRLLLSVRDVTREELHRKKLTSLHQAGLMLADLSPEEIRELEAEERIELLKANILDSIQNILEYDVVEIRLLEERSKRLAPLLAVGLTEEAAVRELHARPNDNGVTGFVAFSKKSYVCDNTLEDPLYIEGSCGAKSSLTAPLIYDDEVIGTLNVESPRAAAFSESDVMFLEMFARNVAAAIHTLELLEAKSLDVIQRHLEDLHRSVAGPIDYILRNAARLLAQQQPPEQQLGLTREIQEHARVIRQTIHMVGSQMTPLKAVLASDAPPDQSPSSYLNNRRVLVVDSQENVCNDAHCLLDRYGCEIETAASGAEALAMVQALPDGSKYSAILTDIRLPDMNAYELMMALKETLDPLPLVLMQGYGYDPSHTLVKCRREGLHPKALLHKPFLVNQLLDVLKTIITEDPPPPDVVA